MKLAVFTIVLVLAGATLLAPTASALRVCGTGAYNSTCLRVTGDATGGGDGWVCVYVDNKPDMGLVHCQRFS